MKVLRSAAGAGLRLFSRNFTQIKASTGLRDQAVSDTSGTGGFTGGWKAHHFEPMAGPSQSAPSLIQARMTSISSAVSGLAGGICRYPTCTTALYSRLSSAL